jgi:membrane protein YqaA with SNARE-associated domain
LLAWLQTLTQTMLAAITPGGLAFLSFIEAIFFPVPPDTLLIPLTLLQPEKGILWAAIATVSSVAGASIGYLLGLRGGRPLLRRFASTSTISRVHNLFSRYDMWAIAIAGFTPIPYKVFAIAAGVFAISFRRFMFASVFSRMARFGLEAVLLMMYGEAVADYMQNKFEYLTLVIALVAMIVVLVWLGLRRRRS